MIWNVNGRMRFLWLMPLFAVNNVNFFQPGHTLFFYFQSAVFLPCFHAWLQATPTVMSSEQSNLFSGSSSLLSKSLSVSRFLKTTHNKNPSLLYLLHHPYEILLFPVCSLNHLFLLKFDLTFGDSLY